MPNTYKPSPKDFSLVILGQVISIFGSTLLRFGLSLYVLDITGRVDLFATLYAVSNIPILLAPLGGAIADRFNRRNLMVIIDFSNSAVVLCFLILLLAGNASIVFIGIVMVVLSAINSIESPTVTACIPFLVEESKLEQANGIVQAVQALSSVVAPVMGGILYGVIEMKALVIISCAAFFIAAVMEIFIKIPFVKKEHEGNMVVTIAKDMKEGFAYVAKQPFILKSMILGAVLNLILSPLLIIGGPTILRVVLQSSETMYGVGIGLISFASVLGALTVGIFAKKMEMSTLYRWIIAISLLILPITASVLPFIIELGYYPGFILFMLGAIPIAMAASIISIFVIAKVQRVTPNDNLGKVMAIVMAVAQCAAPLGQMVYGLVFESFGNMLYLPIFSVSLIMLIIAIISRWVFTMKSVRDL